MTPYELLAEHIVLQAVNDYRRALRGIGIRDRKPKSVIIEVESFFRSEYYRILSNVDGELIICKLRKEYEDECNSRKRTVRPYRKHR